MGSIDIEARNYLRDSRRFADAFNYLIYDGRQVIDPDRLRPLDTAEIAILREGKRRRQIQAFRDGLKEWQAMQDDRSVYVILGAEAQAHIHYAMPVKGGLYDFMEYSDQVEARRRAYAGNDAGEKPRSSDEFLSGFRRDDRLKPVLTLVIYFGDAEWDGPMSLHDMFDIDDPQLLRFIPDYRLNLIAPALIPEDDFQKFQTNFGRVLEFIKYSRDKEKLMSAVNRDARYRSMDPESYALIQLVTHSDIHAEVKEGKVDMCQAIEEMKLESWTEGREEGRAEGREEGERYARTWALRNLMRNMDMTLGQAMDALSIPAEDRARYAELVGLHEGVCPSSR